MPLLKISDKGVFSGQGSLARLEEVMEGCTDILLFADRDGFKPCGAAGYFETLEKKGKWNIRKILYTGKALPLEDIEDIYKKIKEEDGGPSNGSPAKVGKRVDFIVAIGGGTV
ncbi:MAG: phosphonoacetaldehyde reductase, partial [bacterium]|nr:phosphonoacetaldehyde reductase [bacterium]